MPASMEDWTRESAVGWSTVPMALNMPVPPWKVMQPKQSWETRRPVSPRVLYCMMILCAEYGGAGLDAWGTREEAVDSSEETGDS